MVKGFCAALITMVLLDYVWLGVVMGNIYSSALGGLARRSGDVITLNWSSTVPVYILIPLGLLSFAVPRADNIFSALLWGGLFGLVVYGVYNLTNHAVLRGYPRKLILYDTAWGTVLCGLATVAAYLVMR